MPRRLILAFGAAKITVFMPVLAFDPSGLLQGVSAGPRTRTRSTLSWRFTFRLAIRCPRALKRNANTGSCGLRRGVTLGQRLLYASRHNSSRSPWLRIVRHGGPDCELLVDTSSVEEAYSRLLAGEEPPRMPTVLRRWPARSYQIVAYRASRLAGYRRYFCGQCSRMLSLRPHQPRPPSEAPLASHSF